MKSTRVRVTAEAGLHARPAAQFSQAAANAAATVTIGREGQDPVPAESLLSVVTLAVRQGEQVVLNATGAQAEHALTELTALIGEPVGAGETGAGTAGGAGGTPAEPAGKARDTSPAGLIAAIERHRVVPTIRADTGDAAYAIAERVLAGGLPVAELTTTVPGWAGAFTRLRAAAPDALLGLGTLRSADDARTALDLGADFLVSPSPMPAVREVAADAGRLFIEGGFTPGEIADAAGRGIAKLFPAHVGGIAYLKSLLATMPDARIIATGGVKVEDVPRWIAAGAVATSVGSDLYAADDIDAVVARLTAAIAEVSG